MKELSALIETIERLLAPDGCPWDREQTFLSLRSSLVEETYELIEAIDLDKNIQIEEELGDLLLLIIFYSKMAEKEGRFSLKDVANHINAKLIRRHPHIFGDAKVENSDEVIHQWEEIKRNEKKENPRHSALDSIPKDLPTLARAQEVSKKLNKKGFNPKHPIGHSQEEQAGQSLWSTTQEMLKNGIQPDQALRKRLTQIEQEFRAWEKTK